MSQLIKLVLVLLRWWAETHSQRSQSKARAGTGTGGGSRVLRLSWLIAELSVTLLCEEVGAEKTDKHVLFFIIPIDLIQLYKKSKHFTYNRCDRTAAAVGLANEEGEEGPLLGGQRCGSGLASRMGRAGVCVIPLSVPPSSLGLSGLWQHLSALPSLFSPCMAGFVYLGRGYIPHLALPNSQGCISIMTSVL